MNKKNIILGGILLVLVVFAYIWTGPLKNFNEKKKQEKNFLAGLLPDKLTKVEIEKAGTKTILEKEGDKWKIGGTKSFYASKAAAEEMIYALEKAAKGNLEAASKNKDKKSAFGVGAEGLKIKAYEGEKVFSFIVGLQTPDYAGSYISQENDDKTYKAGIDLSSVFAKEEWRDLQIFSFMKERASKVRFQSGRNNFSAEKKENKWSGVLPRKFPVSEEKINAVLAVLENLSAAKIPAQDFKGTGLEKNNLIIQAAGEGFDNTLMVGDCTKENFCYAKRGDNDNIYLITKAQKEALNKKMADLK